MLKPNQCAKDLFDKAWRMAHYRSEYVEQCLIEQNGVNPGDAARIVGLAKQLHSLDFDFTNINAQEPGR